ncbi:hypothetical protein D9611_000729 [Ephemerocybe angulata]|uniref:MYND-type domain-containing protein n=1 Tax=Ephemerocybe angulata TaxID=980116 RepID=A0A8H5BMV8_9AGAR|nr:hypothetical protein D9611_000729 [Tulosesus angulatus]
MDRRHGTEGKYGIAGGQLISKESERNLNIARDLCQRRKPNEAVPYIMKALEDPHNLDAAIELAFVAPTPKDCVQVLEEAARRGKKILLEEWLGPTAFDDDGEFVGNYWALLETRPYMRVLQAIARMTFETGQYTKSTKTQIEMLRLCPGDNLAVRKNLGSALIRDGRYADALYFAQAWLHDVFVTAPVRGGTLFKEPSKDTLSDEEEAKFSTYCCGELIHTAALASFKLFGDCEQSRQYLRIASKANPHILLRILGKIRRPDEINRLPRTINGPEDAHDYLWLSQDLWMEDSVWEWANNNPDAKQVILKNCSRPGCRVREADIAQFKRCSACHLVSYCDPQCQRAHWSEHKKACKEHQAIKAATKAFSLGKPVAKDAIIMAATDFTPNGIVTTVPKRKKT